MVSNPAIANRIHQVFYLQNCINNLTLEVNEEISQFNTQMDNQADKFSNIESNVNNMITYMLKYLDLQPNHLQQLNTLSLKSTYKYQTDNSNYPRERLLFICINISMGHHQINQLQSKQLILSLFALLITLSQDPASQLKYDKIGSRIMSITAKIMQSTENHIMSITSSRVSTQYVFIELNSFFTIEYPLTQQSQSRISKKSKKILSNQ
ncbi:hypothetical protein ABPG74_006803 [Tetrahymena malaccensis]